LQDSEEALLPSGQQSEMRSSMAPASGCGRCRWFWID